MSRSVMKFKPIIEDMGGMTQEEKEARWELWRQGDLSWKLDECQLPMYDAITDQSQMDSTLLISRRFGKSYSCLIAEIEVCIQQPYIICKHACPTQKMVKEMIYPQLRIIFQDAPPEFNLDDMWNATEGKLKFPNGSFITIAGTDGNNADNLRGTYCHLAFCDEAGFMENLEYVVRQILRPQLLTTGGKIVLISTPNPRELNHEFHTKFVFPAEAAGKLLKLTIHDNKRLSKEEIQREIDSYPLKENDPAFRVEYLVEVPRNTELSVVPEFFANKSTIVTEDIVVPELCDFYTAGDIGVKDLTVYIFGFYDFKEATLCILDEWVENGLELTTQSIADAIKAKERKYFVNSYNTYRPPFRRVMDNNLNMINDLRILHGLNFLATKKDKKVAQINQLRLMISEGRLKIHPRCKNLIYHIENAQWKNNKSAGNEFEHLTGSMDGGIKDSHCDGLDAINYLVRNINYNHNPYPNTKQILNESQYQHNRNTEQAPNAGLMQKLFGVKGKRK